MAKSEEYLAQVKRCRALLNDLLPYDAKLAFVETHRPKNQSTTHRYRVFLALNGEVLEVTRLVGLATETYDARHERVAVRGGNFAKPEHVVDILRRVLGEDFSSLRWENLR